MIQLALKLAERTLDSLKNLAASIVTGLTGNANFPTPSPTTANITTGCDDLTAAQAELTAAEDVVVLKRENVAGKRLALENLIRAIGANCLDTVKLDPEALARTKLLSANLPLRVENAPVDEILRPTNFQISQGDHSGELDGGCNKVKNAKMYRVRCGATVTGPWETKYENTKSSFTISGLPVGVCFAQMAAFGTNGGWSEWSDVASIHVV